MIKESGINIQKIKQIRLFLFVVVSVGFLLFGGYFITAIHVKKVKSVEEKELSFLKGIVETLASSINGNMHQELINKYPDKNFILSNEQDSLYFFIHKQLRAARDKNHLPTDISTIVLKNSVSINNLYEAAFYGVSSSDNPYFKQLFTPSLILVELYKKGGTISLYKNQLGAWISAFAPVTDLGGNTVAIVQIELPFDEYINNARKEALVEIVIVGFIILLITGFIIFLVNRICLRLIEEQSSLQKRFENINSSYSEVVDCIKTFTKGDYNSEISLDGEYKELEDSLFKMQKGLQDSEEEIRKRKIEEDRQNWATRGLAKFAEILRYNNDNMEKFSYEVIKNMVEYLEANQGGIFILDDTNETDESNTYFEQKATFAYDRKKFVEKKILLGEGLVGTSIQEQETVYMTDIPESYISITSGLGKANPTSLLIVPLKFNDEAFGALELASFKKIEKYQVEFVEKVAESIASTIATVKINVRTQNLLKKSQEQTEAMQSQEEEMRQNMEEMQATHEETARVEKDLRDQIENLNAELNEARTKIVAIDKKKK